jgi:hypothetical protein
LFCEPAIKTFASGRAHAVDVNCDDAHQE